MSFAHITRKPTGNRHFWSRSMDKVGMHVRMPAWMDDAVRERAWELRMSPQEFIRNMLASILIGPKG